MTNPCQVWVRSLGSIATKIRVIELKNAIWLREQLGRRKVDCTEPLELRGSRFFTFRALHVNQIDHSKLVEIIRQIPDVELMFEPA